MIRVVFLSTCVLRRGCVAPRRWTEATRLCGDDLVSGESQTEPSTREARLILDIFTPVAVVHDEEEDEPITGSLVSQADLQAVS